VLNRNEDGTFTAGALDVLAILHDVEKDTYHPAFFAEAPPPGPPQLDWRRVSLVRLKCRMHHTEGAPDLETARAQFDDLASKIQVPAPNRWRDQDPVEWDGEMGLVLILDNWRADEQKEAARTPEEIAQELTPGARAFLCGATTVVNDAEMPPAECIDLGLIVLGWDDEDQVWERTPLGARVAASLARNEHKEVE